MAHHPATLAAGLLAGLLQVATPATAAAATMPELGARIEHRVELPAQRTDGLRLSEISGLAWHDGTEELLAVSDRGRLFRLQLTERAGALQVRVLSARQITLPALPSAHPNTEALAWHSAPGTAAHGLWATAETSGTAMQIDDDGRVVTSLPWPAAARAPSGSSHKHGVEALAWHPRHGMLVALQRPLPGASGNSLHAVHASDGRSWRFAPTGPRSHLKAIELLADGRLLVLERLDLAKGTGHRSVLRWLDLAACSAAPSCETGRVAIDGGLADGHDNFEGLACTAAGRCWIASDSGADGKAPTRLVQFQLAWPTPLPAPTAPTAPAGHR